MNQIHVLRRRIPGQCCEGISKRVKFGRREKAKKGKFNGSLPPFGYTKDGNTLELHPEYSPVVVDIFRLYLYENWGLYKISRHLIDAKIPTPRTVVGAKNAGELWQQSIIKLILTNPVYTGNMIQNRSETVSIRTRQRKKIPLEDRTAVYDTHPALISMEEFEEVQNKLTKKGKQRSNGRESLFAHIAVCADCGMGMHFKKDRGGYTCGRYGKYGKKHCSSHYIKADDLLTKVKDNLKSLILGNGVKTRKLVDVLKKESGHVPVNYEKEIKQVDSKIAQLTRKQSKLLDLLNDGDLTQQEWRTHNTLVRDEFTLLTNRKSELQTLTEKEDDLDSDFQAFEKQVNKLLSLDFEDEKILKQVISKLVLKVDVFDDSRIKIHFNIINPTAKKGA
ncbi:recombinase family protein [Paenibacillus aceris]|uniref:Recombinase domain-containing protein n=1 Tax=Paenibacillus aceris TaxID=869555 RepID=A0ABS4I680_9BACL|nr:recombinase family protein [Paenibacillus aceris]MBP1966422.1 hypothetical protein [Paenibacillus aceris]NHW39597.1 recombinase family protein [Paenibacillus aceris]